MSVRSLIRNIVSGSNLADPREISDKLVADCDPADYEDLLREALPEFVRQELGKFRMQARDCQPTFRSRKVAAYQSWARRLRAMRVLGDGAVWKSLNDCAAVDLVQIVEFNRTQAARNLSTAAQYESLLTALRKAKVATVAGLDDATVEAAFGGSK